MTPLTVSTRLFDVYVLKCNDLCTCFGERLGIGTILESVEQTVEELMLRFRDSTIPRDSTLNDYQVKFSQQ